MTIKAIASDGRRVKHAVAGITYHPGDFCFDAMLHRQMFFPAVSMNIGAWKYSLC